MRTPALKLLDSTISNLNTHFAISRLFAEQFLLAHSRRMRESPSVLTTTAFVNSDAAKRINIPLGKLHEKTEQFEGFLLSQCISRCSDASKSYFNWVEVFNIKMFNREREQGDEELYFESIAKQVGASKIDLAPRECFLTLDHVRKRRNSLVHNDEEATAAFLAICRTQGNSLNRYWEKRLGRKCRIDFLNSFPAKLDGDAFIDLIHLVRLSVETFDENYCDRIPSRKLRGYIQEEFVKRIDCSKIDDQRREKKFAQFSLRLFGVCFDGNGCVA